VFPGFLLVDGFVAGTWRLEARRDGTTLYLEPEHPLPAAARDELAEEGARLLAFATPGGTNVDIRFSD
jgi:hypothetical protein